MELKEPALLSVEHKGLRGLAHDERAYAARGIVLEEYAGVALDQTVRLKPGEETAMAVLMPGTLPPNADVKSIVATLSVEESAAPPPTTIEVKEGTTARTYSLTTGEPLRPRNVTVRLEGGDVFWSFGGVLADDRYDLRGPEFAEQVNAYLDRLHAPGGSVVLPFLVRSDTAGRIRVEITQAPTYGLVQTESWTNPLDGTIRLDRNLELDFSATARVALTPVAVPAGATLARSSLRFDLGGTFGAERLLGDVVAERAGEFATVSVDYAVAQRFALDPAMATVHAVGIAGAFVAAAEAELYLELQPDAGDVPAAGPPLAKATITLAAQAETGNGSWTAAHFDAPVDLAVGTPYWIVAKGIRGTVRLGLRDQPDGYLGAVLVHRGGQLWKPLRPPAGGDSHRPAALVRLLYLPGADNQTAAIEIGLDGTTTRRRVEPTVEAQNLTLEAGGLGPGPAVLVIRSHARGTLSIANVIQEYAPAG